MKNILSKKKWIIFCVCLLLVLSPLVAMASSSLDIFKREYAALDEKEVSEKLSKYSFEELCTEINILSKSGIGLPDLIFHSATLAEKTDKFSASDLLKIVENKSNSENLRIICLQLIDYADIKLYSQDSLKLSEIILSESENSLVRQNAVWLLTPTEESYNILEKVIFQDDEKLAFQALKKLNHCAPERAKTVAETLLNTEEHNDKLRMAIKVISSQLSLSNDNEEKDK